MEDTLMPPYVFCEQCQCEVRDCEHLSHERKMAKIKEIEAGWENDPQYLVRECERLWLVVNREELTGERVPRVDHDRAMEKLLRLQSALHKITRRPNCDCTDCREHGWYKPSPKQKPKPSLKAFLEQGDHDTADSAPAAPPRAHTPLEGECTCDLCKKFFAWWPRVTRGEIWERRRTNVTRDDGTRKPWTEAERAEWRHLEMTHSRYQRSFIVVETGRTITIGNLEAEEFLAEYPTALELKNDDCL
jgi:hypothetical protein